MTGDDLRAAIAAACDLTNPRLSEVDWDAVALVGQPSGPERPDLTSAVTRLLWLHDEGARVMEGGAFVDAMDVAMEALRLAASRAGQVKR